MQQNEILDVFYDDYLSLADDETTFGAKSDNYLKVGKSLSTFSDEHNTVSYLKFFTLIN